MQTSRAIREGVNYPQAMSNRWLISLLFAQEIAARSNLVKFRTLSPAPQRPLLAINVYTLNLHSAERAI